MLIEEWRPVVGYEGSYEVSSHGRVRSLDRSDARSDGRTYQLSGRLLAPHVNSRCGSIYLRLLRGREFKVSRLVLTAFDRAPAPDECALHWDDNPANNRFDNLRWGSKSDNAFDKVRNGREHNSSKDVCPLDHFLIVPNLVPSKLPHRNCLACSRAHRFKKLSNAVFVHHANEHYKRIMSEVSTV